MEKVHGRFTLWVLSRWVLWNEPRILPDQNPHIGATSISEGFNSTVFLLFSTFDLSLPFFSHRNRSETRWVMLSPHPWPGDPETNRYPWRVTRWTSSGGDQSVTRSLMDNTSVLLTPRDSPTRTSSGVRYPTPFSRVLRSRYPLSQLLPVPTPLPYL